MKEEGQGAGDTKFRRCFSPLPIAKSHRTKKMTCLNYISFFIFGGLVFFYYVYRCFMSIKGIYRWPFRTYALGN